MQLMYVSINWSGANKLGCVVSSDGGSTGYVTRGRYKVVE